MVVAVEAEMQLLAALVAQVVAVKVLKHRQPLLLAQPTLEAVAVDV
jgi:hypothetical protein